MTATVKSENQKVKCACGHAGDAHLCSYRWGIHTCTKCSREKGEQTSERCSVRGKMSWEVA